MIDLHGHGKKYFIIYSDSILFSFLVKILKKKTLLNCASVGSFVRIKALDKPKSVNPCVKVIKTVDIPISPKSEGDSSLARKIAKTNEMLCLKIVNERFQYTAFKLSFFKSDLCNFFTLFIKIYAKNFNL
jgi:hypothetical protein